MTEIVGDLAARVQADLQARGEEDGSYELMDSCLGALVDAGGALPTQELVELAASHLRVSGGAGNASASGCSRAAPS
jgi:hypothetical protein